LTNGGLHPLAVFGGAFAAHLRHDPGHAVQLGILTRKGDEKTQQVFHHPGKIFRFGALVKDLLLGAPFGNFALTQGTQDGGLILEIGIERHVRHTHSLGNRLTGNGFRAGFLQDGEAVSRISSHVASSWAEVFFGRGMGYDSFFQVWFILSRKAGKLHPRSPLIWIQAKVLHG